MSAGEKLNSDVCVGGVSYRERAPYRWAVAGRCLRRGQGAAVRPEPALGQDTDGFAGRAPRTLPSSRNLCTSQDEYAIDNQKVFFNK